MGNHGPELADRKGPAGQRQARLPVEHRAAVFQFDQKADQKDERGKERQRQKRNADIPAALDDPLEHRDLVVFHGKERCVVHNGRPGVAEHDLLEIGLAHDVFPIIVTDLEQAEFGVFGDIADEDNFSLVNMAFQIGKIIEDYVIHTPLKPILTDLGPKRFFL